MKRIFLLFPMVEQILFEQITFESLCKAISMEVKSGFGTEKSLRLTIEIDVPKILL